MRKTAVTTVLALALALSLAAAAQAAPKGLTRIADNVYAHIGAPDASPKNSFAANAGVVVGKDGVLVIDTLASASQARLLLKEIRAVTNKPVTFVVTTHGHFDHAFGSSVFTDRGAVLLGHRLDRAGLEKGGPEMLKKPEGYGLTQADLAGTRVILPALEFSERMTIHLGGETVVELIHLQPSHSPGSILVHLPKQKVLFAGDNLFTDFHPFMGAGDVPGWVKTLDYIQGLDLDAIIPGHGPVSSKKDVAEMRDYLLRFDAKARELVAAGKDAPAAAAELKGLLPPRSMGEAMILFSLKMKYFTAAQ